MPWSIYLDEPVNILLLRWHKAENEFMGAHKFIKTFFCEYINRYISIHRYLVSRLSVAGMHLRRVEKANNGEYSYHTFTIALHPGQRFKNHANLTIRKIITQMFFHQAQTFPTFILKCLLYSSNLFFVNEIINA